MGYILGEGPGSFVGENWRTAARGAGAAKPMQKPEWLTAAMAFKGAPTANQLFRLAGAVRDFRVNILLGGEAIAEAGLIPRLGTISRSTAYRALARIADGAFGAKLQQPIDIALEDASALISRDYVDNTLLAEMFQVRKLSSDLAQARVRILSAEGMLVHEMPGPLLAKLIENTQSTLPVGASISGAISKWSGSGEGWEVFHDAKSGDYKLAQIISETV